MVMRIMVMIQVGEVFLACFSCASCKQVRASPLQVARKFAQFLLGFAACSLSKILRPLSGFHFRSVSARSNVLFCPVTFGQFEKVTGQLTHLPDHLIYYF